jgi:hypothetical protein
VREIALTRGKVALVDDADYEWLNQWKWQAAICSGPGAPLKFWAVRSVKRAGKNAAVLMHRQIIDAPADITVDHRNRDTLDDQRSNLRLASRAQQMLNRSGHQTGKASSQYKGVYLDRKRGKWRAEFRHRYLGTFPTEVDAAVAYDAVVLAFDPEFSLPNFPRGEGACPTFLAK